ncbi:MAG: hypothetical protein LJE84_14060 [Gammaproteobacteria bacterium]|jgi:hypothetical protein|nr:hypothetical protein [Gammaproteobacteria bacterium]
MRLNLLIGDQVQPIEVPADMLGAGGEEFYARMDADMDGGWQMSMHWVENPGPEDRCRIAADRIMDAMASGKEVLAQLMAGYILSRLPDVIAVRVDTTGEITLSEFVMQAQPTEFLEADRAAEAAAEQVASVYRSGRTWRFATFEPALDRWVESPAFASEEIAQQVRESAVRDRQRLLSEPPAD